MDDFDFEYDQERYEDDLYEHECNQVALDEEFEAEQYALAAEVELHEADDELLYNDGSCDEGSDGEDEDYDFEAGSQI